MASVVSPDSADSGGSGVTGSPGASRSDARRSGYASPRLFGALAGGIFIADQITKRIAVDSLGAAYVPHDVLGNVVRLTLVYNPGAAFGLHLGAYSRWIFTGLTVGALFLLWRLYLETVAGDGCRVLAIGLVVGGAVGNLVDRLRSARGVVDFIDVGIGSSRWPTFNVADMAVSCGAILLAYVLWREDVRIHEARAAHSDSGAPDSATNVRTAADAPLQD